MILKGLNIVNLYMFILYLQYKFTLKTNKMWQMLYTFAESGKYCTFFANMYNVCHLYYLDNVNLYCTR